MSLLASFAPVQGIVIAGPTAVGKSELADKLAFRLHSEVLSADSMQIYRGMDIGTAKMAPQECSVPLRLVDIVDPGIAYSAALYQRDGRLLMDGLLSEGAVPVICGGTGLYIRALLDAMEFPSGEAEDPRRKAYQELSERDGSDALYKQLCERDPESAAVIHPHNVRRVIRALEMADDGESYARQKAGFSAPKTFYHARYFALARDRERLYQRINLRVDIMFEQGLVDEVQGLMNAGFADALTSMQAIGYKEVIQALRGQISMDEARDLIKMRSRRYAKRQLSWFKRDTRYTWLDMNRLSIDDALQFILNELDESCS